MHSVQSSYDRLCAPPLTCRQFEAADQHLLHRMSALSDVARHLTLRPRSQYPSEGGKPFLQSFRHSRCGRASEGQATERGMEVDGFL